MLNYIDLFASLNYDPVTGVWTRLIASTRGLRGSRADHKRAIDTRRTVHVMGCEYLAHRLAWFYMTGQWPSKGIDHENTDPSDNRWINLRQANQRQNSANMRRPKHNKSGVKGVYWNKEKRCWTAQIKKQKSTHLGYFKNIAEAGDAYARAAKKIFGEFARHD